MLILRNSVTVNVDNNPLFQLFKFIRLEVQLLDTYSWQFFAQPKELKMLNMKPNNVVIDYVDRLEQILGVNEGYVHYIFALDPEKDIGNRSVKDFVTLFADIGGQYSFFYFIAFTFVGSIPSQLFSINMAENLYRFNLAKSNTERDKNYKYMTNEEKTKSNLRWFQ